MSRWVLLSLIVLVTLTLVGVMTMWGPVASGHPASKYSTLSPLCNCA